MFRISLSKEGYVERPTLLPPPNDINKYDRGAALIFSGPVLRTGASRLAAQAALGVGAGLVTLVGTRDALVEHSSSVTSVMLREIDEPLSCIDERVRALAAGPALGFGDESAQLVLALLATKVPIVLDADALTVFAPDPLRLFAATHQNAVLTPHQGEFARLFPDLGKEPRESAAKQAANRAGAVLLLKGPKTAIACPNGRTAINRHSAPWLATAGSGDVLTGIICGLLAQGVPAFEAAAIGAWLHGDIAVRAGPGLTADTMLNYIPTVLKDILQEQ